MLFYMKVGRWLGFLEVFEGGVLCIFWFGLIMKKKFVLNVCVECIRVLRFICFERFLVFIVKYLCIVVLFL